MAIWFKKTHGFLKYFLTGLEAAFVLSFSQKLSQNYPLG